MAAGRWAWLTPEDEAGRPRARPVFVPAGLEYEAALRGALLMLSQDYSWEKFGAQAPIDVAAVFDKALDKTVRAWRVPNRFEYAGKILFYLPDNLIGYWPSWEPDGATLLRDFSASAADGVLAGATFDVAGIGDGNTALHLAGSSSGVELSSTGFMTNFNGDEGTFAAWLKPTSGTWTDGNNHCIFEMRSVAWPVENRVYMLKDNNNGQLNTVHYGATAQVWNQIYSQSWYDWTHIALSWSVANNALRLYLNGSFAQESTGLAAWDDTIYYALIGAYPSYVLCYDGDIAHPAFWSRALSDDEIAYLGEVV